MTPLQQDVLAYIKSLNDWVTSAEVGKNFNIETDRAGQIMVALTGMGELEVRYSRDKGIIYKAKS